MQKKGSQFPLLDFIFFREGFILLRLTPRSKLFRITPPFWRPFWFGVVFRFLLKNGKWLESSWLLAEPERCCCQKMHRSCLFLIYLDGIWDIERIGIKGINLIAFSHLLWLKVIGVCGCWVMQKGWSWYRVVVRIFGKSAFICKKKQ